MKSKLTGTAVKALRDAADQIEAAIEADDNDTAYTVLGNLNRKIGDVLHQMGRVRMREAASIEQNEDNTPNTDTAGKYIGLAKTLSALLGRLNNDLFVKYDGDIVRWEKALQVFRGLESALQEIPTTPVPESTAVGKLLRAYHRAHQKIYEPSRLWLPRYIVPQNGFKEFNAGIADAWKELSRDEQIVLMSAKDPFAIATMRGVAEKPFGKVLYLLQLYHAYVRGLA